MCVCVSVCVCVRVCVPANLPAGAGVAHGVLGAHEGRAAHGRVILVGPHLDELAPHLQIIIIIIL